MAGQCHRRGRARLPQEPPSVPSPRADRPNALWSWDISFLHTTVRGVWLSLYLVVDVWSRKVVAWNVVEVESAQIAADLVQRACLGSSHPRSCTPSSVVQCVGRRWKRGWRRWACSDPSLGQGSQTTTPTQNPCFVLSSPGRTPQPALCMQGRGLRMGSCICGLVQPPTPAQRHQIRDAPSAS